MAIDPSEQPPPPLNTSDGLTQPLNDTPQRKKVRVHPRKTRVPSPIKASSITKKDKDAPPAEYTKSQPPAWYRDRKLLILYYRSSGFTINAIAQRMELKKEDVRRYLDEILADNSV